MRCHSPEGAIFSGSWWHWPVPSMRRSVNPSAPFGAFTQSDSESTSTGSMRRPIWT